MTRPLVVVQTTVARCNARGSGSHFFFRFAFGVCFRGIKHVDAVLKGDFDDVLIERVITNGRRQQKRRRRTLTSTPVTDPPRVSPALEEHHYQRAIYHSPQIKPYSHRERTRELEDHLNQAFGKACSWD